MLAQPYFVEKTAMASGTGALTVAALTLCQAGDIILLCIESANQSIATPSGGWTQVSNSPQSTGTAAAAGGVRLAVFWKLASGADSTTSVADSGDHTTAIKTLWRGCDQTTPIHVNAGSVQSSASTSWTCPAVTTTIDNCKIVMCIGMDRDAASTANTSAWANSNLLSITEHADETVTANQGGGIAIASGNLESQGSSGTCSVTSAASTTAAFITLALAPDPNNAAQTTGWLTATANSAGSGWTGLGNLYASDNSRATCTTSGTAETGYFYVGGFSGLSIPSTALITGIEVRVEGAITSGTFSYDYAFVHVGGASFSNPRTVQSKSSTDAVTQYGTFGSSFTSTERTYIYGGPADTWGGCDTDNNDVKDRNLRYSDFDSNTYVGWAGAATAGGTWSIDHVSLRIWYTTNDAASPKLTETQTPRVPKANASVIPGVKSETMALQTPKANFSIKPPKLTQTQTRYVPLLNTAVAPGVKSEVMTLLVPTANLVSGSPTLTLTQTVIAPNANSAVSVGVYEFIQALYEPLAGVFIIADVPTFSFTETPYVPYLKTSVTPGHVDYVQTTFAPNANSAVALGSLSETQTLQTPKANFTTKPGHLDETMTLNAPLVPTNVKPGTKNFTQTLFGPKLNVDVKVGVATIVQSLLDPSLIVGISAYVPTLSELQSFLTPKANTAANADTLSFLETLNNVKLNVSVDIDTLNMTQEEFAPSLDEAVRVAVLSQVQELLDPTLTTNLPVGFTVTATYKQWQLDGDHTARLVEVTKTYSYRLEARVPGQLIAAVEVAGTMSNDIEVAGTLTPPKEKSGTLSS